MDVEGRAATRELLAGTPRRRRHGAADEPRPGRRRATGRPDRDPRPRPDRRPRLAARSSPAAPRRAVRFRLATPSPRRIASTLRAGCGTSTARRARRSPTTGAGRYAIDGTAPSPATHRRARGLVRRARRARSSSCGAGAGASRSATSSSSGGARMRRRSAGLTRGRVVIAAPAWRGHARDDRDGAAARPAPRRERCRDDRACRSSSSCSSARRHDPVTGPSRPVDFLLPGSIALAVDRDEPRQPRDHDRLRPLLRRPEAARRVAAQPRPELLAGEDRDGPRRRGGPGRAARRGRGARARLGRRPAPRRASWSSRCCSGRSRSPASGCCSPGRSGPRRCSPSRTSCSCVCLVLGGIVVPIDHLPAPLAAVAAALPAAPLVGAAAGRARVASTGRRGRGGLAGAARRPGASARSVLAARDVPLGVAGAIAGSRKRKNPGRSDPGFGGCALGCGERIRTSDLRVMSPTSCRCSTPRPPMLPSGPGSVKRRLGRRSSLDGRRPGTAARPEREQRPAGHEQSRSQGTIDHDRREEPERQADVDSARTPRDSDATTNPIVPAAAEDPLRGRAIGRAGCRRR